MAIILMLVMIISTRNHSFENSDHVVLDDDENDVDDGVTHDV